MTKCVLIIGVRRQCYKAAIKLGYQVVLWSDEKLLEARKKKLKGWIEQPYSDNTTTLSTEVITELNKYKFDNVIANTEETVVIGSLVRKYLKLNYLAVNITERFHNKWIMKNHASKHEIPITKYKLIESDTSAEELESYLKFPLVIKPVDSSGARDVKIAKSLLEVKEHMSTGLIAESFVKGSEVSVETFVQDGKPIFHNITEYLHQWRKSVVPAKLDKDLQAKILEINDHVIDKFGIDRGMTHAVFYLTENGPVFGEIAIRPPGSYYMELITKAYGFDAWQLYINLSCENKISDFSFKENGCTAVYIIHPGAGKIISINGLDKIKENVQGIFDLSIRREVGDIILPHENTSNEIGHILFWAPNRDQLNKDFEYIESTLHFELENN